ncbi:pentapeptide repeat-containing protein [Sphingomonas sp. R-74633]|uniref:pentapeptide repeat-containing protein n=1 Tax=Sphingomonas sp. R-74633 TaxID=2751188 RepID=UPI0015D3D964|nr:pentapeptide repeat-containing protein [Sphingomonas sp. R-74633]NYT40785.1 pentapeptide repeat-containing protein [Sphingomonas sp. R-74633]
MAIGLFAACATITFIWWRLDPQDPNNLWPEMGGMTLDVFFILIVFALFEHRRSKRQDIARQREVIDDYKRWDHPEAHLRIAGAIRRLNRMGVFALDMSGARLTDFGFARVGVQSLEGSTFYDGRWGERFGDSSVKLNKVSFDHLNCRNVTFSPYNPLSGLGDLAIHFSHFVDCSFNEVDLQNSRFNGSELHWSEPPPETHMEEWEEEEDGSVARAQSSYGPFYRASLRGASFTGCRFSNADFRDSEDILEADFAGAKGLETAYFDNEEIRSAVLSQAVGSATS